MGHRSSRRLVRARGESALASPSQADRPHPPSLQPVQPPPARLLSEQPLVCQTLFPERKVAPGPVFHPVPPPSSLFRRAFPKPAFVSAKTQRKCLPESPARAAAPLWPG